MALARGPRSARWADQHFLLVCAAVLVAACATTGSSMPSREFVGGTALAPGEKLVALPDSGTFAWVDPTNSILHTTQVDDGHRDDPGIPGLREDVSIVLRSHHWREVPADDAMYKLTLTRIDRPDPARNAALNPGMVPGGTLPRCTGAVGERKDVNCTTRLAAIGDGDGMSVTRYGSWMVFVIRRRDGAYYSAKRTLDWDRALLDIDFAPETLALLRSGRP